MHQQVLQEDDIAIVATACVLPGVNSPEDFWRACWAAEPLFKPISDERIKQFMFHETNESSLRISSQLCCEISEDFMRELSNDSKLPPQKKSRLALYAERTFSDLLRQLPIANRGRRQDVIVGCMEPDTLFALQMIKTNMRSHYDELLQQLDENEKPLLDDLYHRALAIPAERFSSDVDHFFTSSILARLAREHGLQGETFLVDSACASSLSSIELASQRLKLGLSDLVVAGGFESNLGEASYLVFSSVGALAKTTSTPFMEGSEGLVQSEGTVLFALKRLADARRDGDTIQAIVRAVGGGSDGRSSSLFQPSRDGQIRVYDKIYGKDRRLDYLEAHGTGTEIGDRTEAASISAFFKGNALPVGSVKAIFGHTKGAAGATGVLKCLQSMQRRLLPPSPAGNSLFAKDTKGPFVNTTPIPLQSDRPLRMGVNAFGFGGTNYHLSLEEYSPTAHIATSPKTAPVPVGILNTASVSLKDFDKAAVLRSEAPFKLLPNSIVAIDNTQLAALLVSWELIKELGSSWHWIPRKKINVVSACSLVLDQIFEIVDLLAFEAMVRLGEAEGAEPKTVAKLRSYLKNQIVPRYAPLNEDAATGILNNVIAGRVCNAFDLHGKSYNIDKDIGSIRTAMATVYHELQTDPQQLFLVIGVEECMRDKQLFPERTTVSAWAVTSESFARQYELILREELTIGN